MKTDFNRFKFQKYPEEVSEGLYGCKYAWLCIDKKYDEIIAHILPHGKKGFSFDNEIENSIGLMGVEVEDLLDITTFMVSINKEYWEEVEKRYEEVEE